LQAPQNPLIALAVAGLAAIAVMVHLLGHVSRDRSEIISARFTAGVFIIAGGGAATLLNAVIVAASVVRLGASLAS